MFHVGLVEDINSLKLLNTITDINLNSVSLYLHFINRGLENAYSGKWKIIGSICT